MTDTLLPFFPPDLLHSSVCVCVLSILRHCLRWRDSDKISGWFLTVIPLISFTNQFKTSSSYHRIYHKNNHFWGRVLKAREDFLKGPLLFRCSQSKHSPTLFGSGISHASVLCIQVECTTGDFHLLPNENEIERASSLAICIVTLFITLMFVIWISFNGCQHEGGRL